MSEQATRRAGSSAASRDGRDGRDGRDEQEAYVETVLSIVEQIPAGRATTYGIIAEAVGRGGPRQVGRCMAMYGAPVPWWRVVRADGSLPESHQREAVARYRQEETPVRGSLADAATLRVDLVAAIWYPQTDDGD
ncbi:MAG: MGMT family protein [Nocardioidaceae bacterium]